MPSVPTQWDDPIGIRNLLLANFLDSGRLHRRSRGLEVLSGARIHGPGPWAVVHGAGAIVSMAGGIQSKCLAMNKAAMNAAIILNIEKGLEVE